MYNSGDPLKVLFFIFGLIISGSAFSVASNSLLDLNQQFQFYIHKYSKVLNININLEEDCSRSIAAAYYYNRSKDKHTIKYCSKMLNLSHPSLSWCNDPSEKWIPILVGHEISHALVRSSTRLDDSITDVYNSLTETMHKRFKAALIRFNKKSNRNLTMIEYLDWIVGYDYHEQVDALGIKLAKNYGGSELVHLSCFLQPIKDAVEPRVYQNRKSALRKSFQEGYKDFASFYSLKPLTFNFLEDYFRHNNKILRRVQKFDDNNSTDQLYLIRVFKKYEFWYLP